MKIYACCPKCKGKLDGQKSLSSDYFLVRCFNSISYTNKQGQRLMKACGYKDHWKASQVIRSSSQPIKNFEKSEVLK